MNDKRRAIRTSIPSATHEFRQDLQRREQLNELENDENLEPAERRKNQRCILDEFDRLFSLLYPVSISPCRYIHITEQIEI
ncbi:unnamed protein product [Didymodactylos carnosus]|uniref:Uncharacterized protein n=1 Tax=Didymodactylos carnosus TaxID=1234261 RepID=A0A815CVK7_9BILA|nr:unnamed protein product [Didymodactylos carnosus]CAF4094376.1 unnamed protein product [Didymodactylos carnosus]